MTQSASQAAAFYREVARTGEVWVLEDDDGQVPVSRAGQDDDPHEVTPVFSSERRALTARERGPSSYAELTPACHAWSDFCDDLGKVLGREGVRLGVNWTGKGLTGYDVPVDEVEASVAAHARPGQGDEP